MRASVHSPLAKAKLRTADILPTAHRHTNDWQRVSRDGYKSCPMNDLPQHSSAELAYLFRHAVLRDAAYNLQLPTDRAAMHQLAYELIEAAFGGPAPEPAPLSHESSPPHAIDPVASELARHAQCALDGGLASRVNVRNAHRRAAEYAERQFRHAEACDHWMRAAALYDESDRGWPLVRAARQLFFRSRVDESVELLDRAVKLARAHVNIALEARALSTMGSVLRQTARGNETGLLYEQALALQRQLDSPRTLAGDLGNLGIFCESEGQNEKAQALYLEALALSRKAGDAAQQARILGYLGDHFRDLGRMDEAYRYLMESIELQAKAGDRPEHALELERLGVWHAIKGNMPEAEASLTKAITMFREMGNHRSLGMALGNMGNLYADTGRLALAEATLLQALNIHQEVGNLSFQTNTLAGLGNVAMQRADLAGALAYFERAMQALKYSRSIMTRGAATLGYATCLALHGRRDEAAAAWEDGVSLLQKGGNVQELESQTASMRAACAKAGIKPLV